MKKIFKNIFGESQKRELSELCASIALRGLAASMVSIFEPIFIYSIFKSLRAVIWYYAVSYLFYIFFLPIGGKIASRYGFEHSIAYSVPIIIIYFILLFNMFHFPHLLFYLSAVILAAYKSLFWPAYYANLAHYGKELNRGNEVSRMTVIGCIMGVIGPAIGGFITVLFGFKILFVAVSILFFCSVIPLFSTVEQFTPSHLSYWKTFQRIMKPYATYTRKDQIAYLGRAEEFSVMVLWPMFIFFTINNLAKIGLITTLASLLSAVVALYIGKLSNHRDTSRPLYRFSVIINSLVWIVASFIRSLFGIFVVDTIFFNTYNAIWVPTSAEINRKGSQRGYLKNALFFEMNLAIGKTIFALILIGTLLFTQNWFILFGMTGAAGLMYLSLQFIVKENA